MTPEQKAAYINSQSSCALIEMAAMNARNENRKNIGLKQEYNEEDFLALIEKYGLHHNSVIAFLRDI